MGFPDIVKCQHKVRLTKLSDNPNLLRDNVIDGVTERLPEVGDFFEMLSRPRDIPDLRIAAEEGHLYMGFRYVSTSKIQKIIEQTDTKIIFRTLNSTYEVEVLADSETK